MSTPPMLKTLPVADVCFVVVALRLGLAAGRSVRSWRADVERVRVEDVELPRWDERVFEAARRSLGVFVHDPGLRSGVSILQ